VQFADARQVVAANSKTVKVTIAPKPASSVSLRSASGKNGTLKVAGTTSPSGVSGAKVEVLALNTAPGAPTRFKVIGTVKLGAGKSTFSFHGKVERGTRWVLQVEYIRPAEASSFSGLRTVQVR
jgi:hypothetical protein